MDKREGKKFYWRVFLVAQLVVTTLIGILFILSYYAMNNSLQYTVGNAVLLIAFVYLLPMYLMPDFIGHEFGLVLTSVIHIILYSLLIERAYYLYRKRKMKKQEGGSGE